jgi:hypothetical protein
VGWEMYVVMRGCSDRAILGRQGAARLEAKLQPSCGTKRNCHVCRETAMCAEKLPCVQRNCHVCRETAMCAEKLPCEQRNCHVSRETAMCT